METVSKRFMWGYYALNANWALTIVMFYIGEANQAWFGLGMCFVLTPLIFGIEYLKQRKAVRLFSIAI